MQEQRVAPDIGYERERPRFMYFLQVRIYCLQGMTGAFR